MKRVTALLGLSTSLLFASTVEAAPSGKGYIDANFVSNRLVLDYTVQGNGSGTAEFSCRVVSPTGNVYNQKQVSTYWKNSKASAQFVFGNLNDRGYYSATCSWMPYNAGLMYKSVLRE